MNLTLSKKEIKFKVQETVEDTSFDVVDGKYVENTKLNRKYISDIYAYLDFNVLFAMENLFDEFYIKIILFNDEKKVGYNLISLSNNLDISIKRVSPKNFLVLGINKDQETQGQASFCNLQPDGSVNEVTINFNYINQYKVIEQKYFLLNYVEVLNDGESHNESGKKTYISTIAAVITSWFFTDYTFTAVDTCITSTTKINSCVLKTFKTFSAIFTKRIIFTVI